MEGSLHTSSCGATEGGLIKRLTSRGWCFKDLALVKGLISIQLAVHGGESCTVDLVESELANTDLRSYGAKSLPDISLLGNTSHLPGPKVLQVASVRDISRSSIDNNSGNSHKRLLRLILTDGYSEITAIEYSHVPSLASEIVPGTKVRLENKTPMHCGIVCLGPKVITAIGGVVQSLYEEWQMNQKYSGFSRSSLRISKESDADSGRPPFEKLQISSLSCPAHAKVNQHTASTSKSYKPNFHGKDPRSDPYLITKHHEHGPKVDNVIHNRNAVSDDGKPEESASNTEGRAREAVEFVPVQNQVAAQKLLQKMRQPDREYHSRGRKYRGKGKEDDEPVLTLDEWERRKAGPGPSVVVPLSNVGQDEVLARQLQSQFDLEDYDGGSDSEAERLRISMFNFQKNDDRGYDGERFRGRGRGRGRRRGRGRGR